MAERTMSKRRSLPVGSKRTEPVADADQVITDSPAGRARYRVAAMSSAKEPTMTTTTPARRGPAIVACGS